jgi:hypothetical protein
MLFSVGSKTASVIRAVEGELIIYPIVLCTLVTLEASLGDYYQQYYQYSDNSHCDCKQ